MAVFSADMVTAGIGTTARAKEHQKSHQPREFLLYWNVTVSHDPPMNEPEIDGRFLPSRVYHRWKGTVRFGILLVFLSGGITLFLTTSKYGSSTVFSLENGPPPAEIVNLTHARRTFQRVTSNLELHKRWDLDKETAGRILDGITEARILPDSSWIELTVIHTNKVDARDIAEEIPNALTAHLRELAEAGIAQNLSELAKLIQDASDTAEEKASDVARIRKVHGPDVTATEISPSVYGSGR
jgi:capsular polysaccharide biosynthesis protein